jgi:transposase
VKLDGIRATRRRDLAIITAFPALPDVKERPETVRRATVFRLYPNRAQEQAFRSWIGAGRWFWNRCVEINEHLYALEGRFAFHAELSALLPLMKRAKGLDWLRQPPAIHLVDVSRRYDAAPRRFLEDRRKVKAGRLSPAKAAGFPGFKTKRQGEGSIYLSGQSIALIRRAAAGDRARGRVELPDMDETVVWEKKSRRGKATEKTVPLRRAVRIRGGRWPAGQIRSATIRRDGNQWYLSVQFDGPPPRRTARPAAPAGRVLHPHPCRDHGPAIDHTAPPALPAVGYDLGCGDLAVASDGHRVPAGRNLRKALRRLRRQRRAASRRGRNASRRQRNNSTDPGARRRPMPGWPRRTVRSGAGGPI